jgi:hypothetical protein
MAPGGLIGLALLVAACAAPTIPSTPEPSLRAGPSATSYEPASAAPSTEASSGSAPSSPPDQASEQPDPEPFPADAMVRTIVAGVTLRDMPSLSGERIGILPEGSRSFVMGDAVEADGYVWMPLSGPGLPPASGCATFPGPELTCPVWRGWAAVGGRPAADPWFELAPADCPDPSSETRAFMMLGDVEALHCYGDRELDFTAWLGPSGLNEPSACPTERASLAWLYCPAGYAAVVQADPEEGVTLELFVEPGSGAEFTRSGYWAIVVGRLDHPSSQQCGEAIRAGDPISPANAILDCRTRFVVTLHGAVAP